MANVAEQDPSGPSAPLLASSPDHDTEQETLAPELQYSGGWFIWALTFSAGISGLLFGYEYVTSLRISVWYMAHCYSLLTIARTLAPVSSRRLW